MVKNGSNKTPERLSVSITFKEEEREHWEKLLSQAEAAGQSRTTFAHDLLIAALNFDDTQYQSQALVDIESRLDVLTRNVARGAYLVLKAAELREAGQKVPDAKEWTHQVMVLKES